MRSAFAMNLEENYSEPRQPFPPATGAWTRVGTDLFKMQGKDYLLIVDYHTNYPEISLLPDTTSATVIKHTKSIFARHGIPEVVISDNGPQWLRFGILSILHRVPIIRKRMAKFNGQSRQ